MKQLLIYLAGFIIGVLIAVFIFYAGRSYQFRIDEATYINSVIAVDPNIPSFTELQTMLVEQGYDIGPKKIDGKIGTDTLKGWDRYLCDQAYMKSIKRMASGSAE